MTNESYQIADRHVRAARRQVLLAEEKLPEGTAAERLRRIADELSDIQTGLTVD